MSILSTTNKEEKKQSKKKKKSKKQEAEEEDDKHVKWKEPSFAEWVSEQHPKENKIMNWAELNEDSYDSDFSYDEGMHMQRI